MLILQSCHKDTSGPFVPYPVQQDTTWNPTDSTPLITDSLVPKVTVDSFDLAATNPTITLGDTANIGFPTGGCMTVNTQGDTVPITKPTQKIKAQILILRTRGDLIRHGMSSIDNQNSLLEFGTFVYVNLFYKVIPVIWKNQNPITITVRDPNPTQGLQFYEYLPTPMSSANSADSAWTQIIGSPSVTTQTKNGSPAYLLKSANLGWLGCSRTLLPNNESKIMLNVALPSNCTNKNTSVYAILNNYKTVIRLTPSIINKNFVTNSKIIPNGIDITLVSISKLSDGYYLGKLSVDARASKINLTPKPQLNGLKDINAFLNSL